MRQILVLLLVVFTSSFAACQQSATEHAGSTAAGADVVSEVLPVDAYEAKLLENPGIQLVDVRTPKEFSNGHIKGARNIDFNSADFAQQLEKQLDKNQPVMLYCRSGKRSEKAARKMAELGFREVYDLQGGFLAWPQ